MYILNVLCITITDIRFDSHSSNIYKYIIYMYIYWDIFLSRPVPYNCNHYFFNPSCDSDQNTISTNTLLGSKKVGN